MRAKAALGSRGLLAALCAMGLLPGKAAGVVEKELGDDGGARP